MSGKAFVDTNVIVYAHDTANPAKCARARLLLTDGMRRGNLVLSTQVLSEFFVTITRKVQQPLPLSAARREVRLLAAFELVPTDAELIVEAIALHERHALNYWDALIVAAAIRGGCEALYSEDLQPGRRFGSVRIENPFAE